MKINYVSLCSGYGAECIAFKRLRRDFPGFDFDCLAWSEIEPNACKAHDAIHEEYRGRNLGDLTKVDWKVWHESIGSPHIDLLFASTPCQSVSNAGKNEGMKKGTDAESALIWATESCIRALNPNIIIYENVKGMVSKRNKPDFDEWCATLESLGYVVQWKILNAKDYGCAQNRERAFPIAIRKDLPMAGHYNYPQGFPLAKCVEDYMDVDDADIDKIMNAKETVVLKNDTTKTHKAISKTACYKLAGNSIVVACRYDIFRTMFIPNQPENQITKPIQQSLFDIL